MSKPGPPAPQKTLRPGGFGRSIWKSTAIGGVAAQGSQAMASFVLQILALRLLGLEDFGRFVVLYGLIVLCTAISSGIVGDSATVLDRHDPKIRAGLQVWGLIVGFGLGAIMTVGAGLLDFVSWSSAIAFGVAAGAFLLEDTLRRLLMACLKFWRLVIVDLASLVGSVAVIGVIYAATGDCALGHVLFALAGGQLLAVVMAVLLLPQTEKYLSPWRAAALGAVARYGLWRTGFRALRPATQSAVLVVAGTVVSLTAVGQLGAARTYMAPTTLVVSGVASVFFAEYASRKSDDLATLLRRANRNILIVTAGVTVMGVLAVVALPWLGPVLTGDNASAIPAVTVAGWAVYSLAIAVSAPYSELSSVRGRHVAVLLVRVFEAVTSVVATLVVAKWTGGTEWVPLTIAASVFVASIFIRYAILGPMVARERENLAAEAT